MKVELSKNELILIYELLQGVKFNDLEHIAKFNQFNLSYDEIEKSNSELFSKIDKLLND